MDINIGTATMLYQHEQYASALRAIMARYHGEFDNPDLVKIGPLHHNMLDDIVHIAEVALGRDLKPYNAREEA